MQRRILRRIRLALAPLLGALLLAIGNAADIAATLRMPPGGVAARAAHHAFDLMDTLALGLVAAALLGTIGHALRHRPSAAQLLYLGTGIVLAYLVLGQDLRHQADYVLSGVPSHLLFSFFVSACGAALPAAHGIGRWCGKRRIFRWLAPIATAGGIVTSHLIVRDDYAPLHGAIEWIAATVAFTSLAPLVRRATSRRVGRAAFTALALAGLFGLAVPPPNSTRVELFRAPGAIGAWALARTVWPRPEPPSGTPPAPPPHKRETPVPPSRPPIVEGAPVIVMITIDATRADVVLDPARANEMPFFAELRRTAATFTRAVSPGSQTSVSLSTLFSGRYFSQLYWSRYGKGSSRFLYAAEDPAVRFPELLVANGVRTALFGGTNFLANEYGVARGFQETHVPEGRRHSLAHEVLDPLIRELNSAGPGPAFYYAHIMEPHAPYDRGKKKGTDYERYVSEVAVADAQVARVAHALAQRFPTQGLLIVSADHGEAFGEHGTYQHTKTLYDELLHVPMFIRGGHVRARSIAARVSLADIGPTVLDVFGVPVPPSFMGASLLPLLRGADVPLERPVIAEGRLRRALYTDGVKIILDMRRELVEAYDLDRDPAELYNLFDVGDPRAASGLAALNAFFDAYELKRPGYSHPYKP